MATIRRVGIWSYTKVSTIFGIFAGFIIGLFYSIIGTSASAQAQFLGLTGPLILIGATVLYAAVGFFSGIVSAALYNFIATVFGGIKIDIK
jgi:energy-converting hydrogenase Eha subunit A